MYLILSGTFGEPGNFGEPGERCLKCVSANVCVPLREKVIPIAYWGLHVKVKTFNRKLKLPMGLVSTNVSATKSECPCTQSGKSHLHKTKSECPYIQIQIQIQIQIRIHTNINLNADVHRGENIGKVHYLKILLPFNYSIVIYN